MTAETSGFALEVGKVMSRIAGYALVVTRSDRLLRSIKKMAGNCACDRARESTKQRAGVCSAQYKRQIACRRSSAMRNGFQGCSSVKRPMFSCTKSPCARESRGKTSREGVSPATTCPSAVKTLSSVHPGCTFAHCRGVCRACPSLCLRHYQHQEGASSTCAMNMYTLLVHTGWGT